jgi:hypothetical protein
MPPWRRSVQALGAAAERKRLDELRSEAAMGAVELDEARAALEGATRELKASSRPHAARHASVDTPRKLRARYVEQTLRKETGELRDALAAEKVRTDSTFRERGPTRHVHAKPCAWLRGAPGC